MNFKIWLFQEEENTVRSYKKANPKNPAQNFIVLYGNTFQIKDELKKMGFRYFQGTWSTLEDKLTNDMKLKLTNLGVDLSGIEAAEESPHPAHPNTTQTPDSKTDQTLQVMKQNVESLIKSEGPNSKLASVVDNIENMIEKIAASTDQAAKQDFINNFLRFSSKFHNYSMTNQLLIWAQSGGKAEHVSSASNWVKLGRTVTDWSKGIMIFAPITVKKKAAEGDEPERVTRFKAVKVFDITATTPIPGHPAPFEPVSRKDWSKDSNEDIEELNVLINALTNWVKEKNIHINYEELSDEHGGSSSGGKIVINNKFKGINLFSTLVHETAHEVLHWLEMQSNKRSELATQSSRKEKEIDAEATAFVVCQHFGFETKDAPNYLALWQAKGEDIKSRKQNIHKAAKMLIQGIQQKVTETDIEFEDEEPVAERYLPSFNEWIMQH